MALSPTPRGDFCDTAAATLGVVWSPLSGDRSVSQKAGVVDEHEAAELKRQAAVGELQLSRDRESLQAAWRALPKPMQKEIGVVRAYAEQAVQVLAWT